ncbi:MAG TPA: glycolate oxidase subunit GlcE [Burkholderiales bacterium]|nr:glycolate oxidase subunit GlcE [Burkholderiales bacterium]
MSLAHFKEAIRDAAARRAPLRLRGGGSKDFFGNEPRGALLDTRGHTGIVDYEAAELVVTARCGTPLAELERVLDERGQCLPFEPPRFGAATFGGCIAAGLSGPRRMSAGAVRDFVLGVKLIDGRARELDFGGRVMKNVAGYDVSRLATGSLGTLGLIAEASVKVLPKAEHETTLGFALGEAQAIDAMNRWAAQPLPLSAAAWQGGTLRVRLSGAGPAVRAAASRLGGEALGDAAAFWLGMREHTDCFFDGPEPLWRLAVPSTTAPLGLAGRQLIEWGGAQRWVKSAAPAQEIRAAAKRLGGHATLFRAADKSAGAFTPLDDVLLRLHRALKAEFDPAGILNPGRLYAEL